MLDTERIPMKEFGEGKFLLHLKINRKKFKENEETFCLQV